MFRWYQQASVCFVYLSDLPASANFEDNLISCRWLKRGWTLQELIAPKNVEFYNASWLWCGTKVQHHGLIAKCNDIADAVLSGQQKLDVYSVATRMKWASTRQTTRPEDRAYCLLEIFDVNMSLIYGEGENAFHRLQELVKKRHQHMSTLTHTSPPSRNLPMTSTLVIQPHLDGLCVPPELLRSYRNWQLYPSNLIDKTAHGALAPINPEAVDEITRACEGRIGSPQVTFGDLHANRQGKCLAFFSSSF